MSLLSWLLERIGMQIVPSVDHLGCYAAKVVSQSGQTVDVTCDDVRIGTLSAVPLQLGIPGGEVTVAAGARVLIGWRGGNPSKPYATTWEAGASVTKLVANATTIHLAAESGSDGVATKRDLQFLVAAITNAACVANDGGLAFKTALLANLGGGGWTAEPTDGSFCSSRVKAKRS